MISILPLPVFLLYTTIMTFLSINGSNQRIGGFESGMIFKRNLQQVRDIHVNTYTNGQQGKPNVAALLNGDFVIAWHSGGQDSDLSFGIYAQMYYANGSTRGSEFSVNANQTSDQYAPRIAALKNGGFVIVWHSFGQDGSYWGVYARIFYENGTAQGSDIRVNNYTLYNQLYPSVTCLNNGSFVVVWYSYGQVPICGIYGQMFYENGTLQGSEKKIHSNDTYDEYFATISNLNEGGFVVTWIRNDTNSSSSVPQYPLLYGNYGIYAKIYYNNGSTMDIESRINSKDYTCYLDYSHQSTCLQNGNCVVVWMSYLQDGSGWEIYARIISKNGITLDPEFRVNTFILSEQWWPTITTLLEGGFMIAWGTTLQDGGVEDIYAKKYFENGTQQGSEYRINAPIYLPGYRACSSIASFPDGSLVIAWESFQQDSDADWGIFYKKYNRYGKEECHLNSDCVTPGYSVCSLSEKQCIQCLNNTNCMNPSFPICSLNQFCIQCESNNNCGIIPGTSICNLTNNTCHPCLYHSECSSNTPFCNFIKGTCSECLSNSNCSNLSKPICNLTNSTCRACLQDTECPTAQPYCNLTKGTCNECRNNINCTNQFSPICDLLTSTCRGCLQDNECPTNLPYCMLATGNCEECRDSINCLNYSKPICDSLTSTCRSCQNDNECPTSRKYCNMTTGTCETCLTNSHCTDIFRPICNLNNFTCRGCQYDDECTTASQSSCNITKGNCQECSNDMNCINQFKPICDLTTSICRSCQYNNECPSTQPICNPTQGNCVKCLSNSTCPDNTQPICDLNNFVCRGCRKDSECPISRSHCNISKGSCEQCLSSINCTNPLLPACDRTNFTCRGCYQDFECLNARPYCNLIRHTCDECVSDFNCSSPFRPICNLANSTCRGCLQDLECSSGIPFCNLANGNCVSDRELSPAIEETFSIFSGSIKTVAAASVPLMGLDPTILWSLVKLCQAFYYFLFLNINYPKNVRAFLSLFSIGKFRFLPNIGEVFPQNQYLFSPPNFYENEYRGFFLETAGSVIFLWTITLSIHGILILLSKITAMKFIKIIYYLKKAKNIVFSAFPAVWDSTCTEFLYGALLQLRIIGVSNFGLTLSTLSSLAIVAYSIISMIFRVIKLRKQQKQCGFSFQECLPVIEHIRRMLPPFPMVTLYYFPFQQLLTLWLLNVGYMLFLIQLKQVKSNKMIFFQECVYFLVNGLIAFFLIPDINPYQRENIGWCVIASFGCLGLIQFGILVQRQGMLVVSSLKKFFNKRKPVPNRPHKRFVRRKKRDAIATHSFPITRPELRSPHKDRK